MNRKAALTFLLVLASLVAPGLAGASSSKATATSDKAAYLGHLVDISAVRPQRQSQAVKIWIDRLTTDQEASHLADVAKARGTEALEEALGEDSVGRVQIGERLSDPVAYARRFEDADGQHLILISRRPISFREFFRSSRSADYPFTVIQLDLDATGRGSGEVLTAARLKVNKDGEIDLENYDFIAARLLAVKPLG